MGTRLKTIELTTHEIAKRAGVSNELAVQSANGTSAASDRTAIQTETTALLAQINDIASRTDFNGTNLLSASAVLFT